MIDNSVIANTLTDRYGLSLKARSENREDGLHIIISPFDLPDSLGFSIDAIIGWATIEVSFILGNYASTILKSINDASLQQIIIFQSFAKSIEESSSNIGFYIDSYPVDIYDNSIWSKNWSSLSIVINSQHMSIDHDNMKNIETLGVTWCGNMLGLILSMLPIESDIYGEAEGGFERVEINKYERSKVNRAACIQIHGLGCRVCGFNFEDFYGNAGYGFVEVHHLEPVSGIQPETIIDPAKDLVPLCANCHAMAHRRKPPYGIEELQNLLKKKIAR